ncbi:hypothetical protein D3C87_1203630 [compost metagenome]
MDTNQLRGIKKLSDHQLLASTDKLVSEERRITLEVLQHLREVEVRRLYIDLEFESMYKYCIQRLKYSEGEAQRRLSAARLLRELPEIESQIQSGDLNITNLSAVQSFVRAEKMADKPLSREEKLELISTVENKSTRQVKQELIQQSHQPALLAEKFQMPSVNLPTALIKFETLMTDENLELLQEFKNLYAHDLADLSNQSVLMFLLNKAVQHKKQKLGLIEKVPRPSNAPLPSAEDVKIKKQRKAIPISVQRQIWKRANFCCEHIDTNSKSRCTSKFALQTDHIISLALGGSNKVDNLRLLCRSHNSRRSIKTFGVR